MSASSDKPIDGKITDSDIVKLQLDYGWKWFNFHADQRTKMFNYMLIALGIFSASVVNAIDKKLYAESFVLCLFGSLVSIIFSRLDRRNQDLVRFGEEVLTKLERDTLFGEFATISNRKGETIPFGILWHQKRQEAMKRRGVIRQWIWDAAVGKHRIWLRGITYLVALVFAAAAAYIWCHYIRSCEAVYGSRLWA